MRHEYPRDEHDHQHADEQHTEGFEDALVQAVDQAFAVTSDSVAKEGTSAAR
jgi:hypothetical protein